MIQILFLVDFSERGIVSVPLETESEQLVREGD